MALRRKEKKAGMADASPGAPPPLPMPVIQVPTVSPVCKVCGAKIGSARFCAKCGAKTVGMQSGASTGQPAPTPRSAPAMMPPIPASAAAPVSAAAITGQAGQARLCPQCGKQPQPNAMFCNYCGKSLPGLASVQNAPVQSSSAPPQPAVSKSTHPKKGKAGLVIIAVIIAVIALLASVGHVVVNGMGGGDSMYLSAPSGVSASAGNGQVTINWNAVTGATSYNIYWSTTSGVAKASGTKIVDVASPHSHTGLTNNVTYYYIVTALNSSGESVASAQVSARPSSEVEHLTGKIAFIVSDDEASHQRALFVMDPDGSNVTQLTDYSIGAQNPAWSPDGRRIAFESIFDGGIYVIDADGTNLTRIVYTVVYDEYYDSWDIAANTHPSWSPDGSKIVYDTRSDQLPDEYGILVFASVNIHVVNSDGTGDTQITDDLSVEEMPSWSPDGSRITFKYDKPLGTDEYGTSWVSEEIYIMDIDGSNWVQLTDSNITLRNHSPDWSPDGTKIVFYGENSTNQGCIYCYDLEDETQTYMGDDIYWPPKWSPDGTKIISQAYYSLGNYAINAIYITNADGSNCRRIVLSLDAYEPDWTA